MPSESVQSVIKPTVGRKVYFHPPRTTAGAATGAFNVIDQDQPLDATVLFVHSDALVNVMVCDHRGNMSFQNGVRLVQPGEDRPLSEKHCTWMPYQVGQAPAASSLIARVAQTEREIVDIKRRIEGK